MTAHTKTKKRSFSPLRRVGRVLYGTILVFSILVVAGFAIFKAVARPPAQQPPSPAAVTPVPNRTDNPDTLEDESALPTPAPLIRRDGVYTFLLAATDVGGGNTDTIMVVTYDTAAATVGVVSIPRDTMVAHYKNPKINNVYAVGGIEDLMDSASDLLGIPIDHYITVNINAFQRLVDAVDGVDFYIPCDMNYDDTTPGKELHIHYSEGMKHLNGRQALEVVRFRHNNDGSGYTDIGRTETQQKLLTAVAKKVLSLSSVTKFNSFVDIFTENVKTDLTAGNITWFASQAVSLDAEEDITGETLPGDGSVKYKGYSWCYELEPEATLDIVNRLLNPYTTELTLDMLNIVQA